MHAGRQQKDPKKTGAQMDRFSMDLAGAADRKLTGHEAPQNTSLYQEHPDSRRLMKAKINAFFCSHPVSCLNSFIISTDLAKLELVNTAITNLLP